MAIKVEQMFDIVNKSVGQAYYGKELETIDSTNMSTYGVKALEDMTKEQHNLFKSNMNDLITTQVMINTEFKPTLDLNLSRTYSNDGGMGGYMQVNRMRTIKATDSSVVYNPDPLTTRNPFEQKGIEVESQYFHDRRSLALDWTIPDKWFAGIMLSPSKLAEFFGMVESSIEASFGENLEALSYELLTFGIGVTLLTGNKNQAINTLPLYNEAFGTNLTAAEAELSPEYIRYTTMATQEALDVLKDRNAYCNVFNYPNAYSDDQITIYMLKGFLRKANTYLMSDVYNKEMLAYPKATLLNKFQAGGEFMGSAVSSSIKVKVKVEWLNDGVETEVEQSGVYFVAQSQRYNGMYDIDRSVETLRDPQARSTNSFGLLEASMIVDGYEDSVVLYTADPENDFVAKLKASKAKATKAKARAKAK